MPRVRISISRVRDPVLYSAYRELGPRQFSADAKEILEAFAGGAPVSAHPIAHYQSYLSEKDACPYFAVGPKFEKYAESLPVGAKAEIVRAILALSFVPGGMAAAMAPPAFPENRKPEETTLTPAIDDETPESAQRYRADGEADDYTDDGDDGLDDLAGLFSGLSDSD